MSMPYPAILRFATRGSPLALAQTNMTLEACRKESPATQFEVRIIKTTGDKLQTASMATPGDLPKGLFTKELEVALLHKDADMAVHSLKDLPTELPGGLLLGAVGQREDARDVLIYRDASSPNAQGGRTFSGPLDLASLPRDATVATSSTRRREQILAAQPKANTVEIRGNVGTRLRKLVENPAWDATILAAAGLKRLGYRIDQEGLLVIPSSAVPSAEERAKLNGLRASLLPIDQMIPCVGQAAIGIETREGDGVAQPFCRLLDHADSRMCVTAERAFLQAMGGGCQSPVAAHATLEGGQMRLLGISFRSGAARRSMVTGPAKAAVELGKELAARLI